MDIVCVGDHIEDGEYVLHSHFSKALNFVKCHPESIHSRTFPLMSCVTQEVGAGPTNIVFRSLNGLHAHSCAIVQNRCIVGKHTYDFDASVRYSSSLRISDANPDKFAARTDLFRAALVQQASPHSLTFLLQPESEAGPYTHSAFELALHARCRDSVKNLLDGNTESGVRLMKGVGLGLTPAGDDFLSGLLLGLWCMQQIDSRNYVNLRQLLYEAALGKNLISNTFLYCAREGWLFERWKDVVKFLLGETRRSEHWIVREILTQGETSGADTAVGLLFALKNAGEMMRET